MNPLPDLPFWWSWGMLLLVQVSFVLLLAWAVTRRMTSAGLAQGVWRAAWAMGQLAQRTGQWLSLRFGTTR